jgi:hypothetical protein
VKFLKHTARSYQHLSANKKMLVQALGLFVLSLVVVLLRSPTPKKEVPQQANISLDTYIPNGFVLVPIEVENFESLDQILGLYGYVDLYAQSEPGTTPSNQPVARSIKLVRSPKNPSHFAVLAPEDKAPWLVRHAPAFRVVVKSQKASSGTQIDVPKPKTHYRRIIIGNE